MLLSSFCFGQINIQKMCSYNYDEAKQFADSLALSANHSFEFFKLKVNDRSIKFYYCPSEISDKEIEKKINNLEPLETITVLFEIYQKGENKDLEIEGKKTYRFVSAEGKFLNLFPFWKKHFVPQANEQNYKDYQMREYKKEGMLVKFDDIDDNGYWYIHQFYCP